MAPPQGLRPRSRRLGPPSFLLALAFAAAPAGAAPPAAFRLDAAAGAWKLERPLAPPAAVPGPESAVLQCEWLFVVNTRPHPEMNGQHLWPDVAVGPDGTFALAWMDDHAAGGYHIFYTFSTDAGVTWAPPEQVDTRVAGGYSKFVDIEFTPSGIPVVVWEDDRLTSINVYFSKRDPNAGGIPWTANVRVNTAGSPPSPADFMNPSLAVLDDERYFIAWTDWREGIFHQVYARATTDGGSTWGVERRVSDGLGYQPVAGDPCLIVDPASGPAPGTETLYCVTNDWRGNVPGGRYPNVYFYRSLDGGGSWSTGVQVNDIEPYYQQVSSHALVQLDDGTLTAGWLNNQDLTAHHFRTNVSTDQGATWSASVQVDPPRPGGTGTYSSLAAREGWVFAGFDLYEDSWNAYFRASADGGRTWSEDACRMDDDATGSAAQNTVLAAASTEIVHSAWSDTRPGLGNWKIYRSRGERGAIGIAEPAPAPAALRIECAPNPAPRGERVRLLIRGPAGGGLRLHISDAAGRAVRVLDLGAGGAGSWDGADGAGRPVPSGVYWLRIDGAPAGGAARVVRLP